jgi:hypothetical protein
MAWSGRLNESCNWGLRRKSKWGIVTPYNDKTDPKSDSIELGDQQFGPFPRIGLEPSELH